MFAEEIGCHNLVFGSPSNRIIQNKRQYYIAINFFKNLGDYAYHHNTILSIEANPIIYNTNFINTTNEAIELVKQVGSYGFMVNLDLGTIIYNGEDLDSVDFKYVNHIHISEPYLKCIEWKLIHKQLFNKIKSSNYQHYICIEMSKQDKDSVKKVLDEFVIDQ